jgi:hypothetical protein
MRFPPFMLAIAGVSLLFNCAFLSLSASGQDFGDVEVIKHPDGSIETVDKAAGRSAPASASSRHSRSSYKKSAQKYNDGVVVRKNADGSIETFDSGGGSPSPRHSSSGRSSSCSVSKSSERKKTGGSIETSAKNSSLPPSAHGSSGSVNKGVHRFPKGASVKMNPDGTIEVTEPISDGGHTGSGKPPASVKSTTSSKVGLSLKAGSLAKAPPSAKTGTASKPKRRAAHRPKGRGNFGDVRVIRNPDGSIETYDAN